MQYKIPVQIENDDPIVLGLSLKQLAVIMIWFYISYQLFVSLAPNSWAEVAAIPSIIIFLISVTVAIFKYYEMTFIPFILAFIRFKINTPERKWDKWVDSFQPIDIWFLTNNKGNNNDNIDFTNKIEKINKIDEQLEKL